MTRLVNPQPYTRPIQVSDAEAISKAIDKAEASLQLALGWVQLQLRSCDLTDVWDAENHAWVPEFDGIASRVTHLQAALRVLADDPDQPIGLDALNR